MVEARRRSVDLVIRHLTSNDNLGVISSLLGSGKIMDRSLHMRETMTHMSTAIKHTSQFHMARKMPAEMTPSMLPSIFVQILAFNFRPRADNPFLQLSDPRQKG